MTASEGAGPADYRSLVIDCLRHGECEGPSSLRGQMDVTLSEAGRTRMCASAEYLPKPDRLISSPLQRCRSVGIWMGERWQLECGTDADLQEMDFGEWDGVALSELAKDSPRALERFWRDPERFPPPGGEPMEAFRSRLLKSWQRLLDSSDRHLVVVTHAGVIKTWLAWVLRMDTARGMYLHRLNIPYAGVVRLRIDLTPYAPPLGQLLFLGVPTAMLPLPKRL